MATELVFKDSAAAEYDRAFAHVTAHFMPFLLHAAHIAPGMHVLDIATGTGLSAAAALAAVGQFAPHFLPNGLAHLLRQCCECLARGSPAAFEGAVIGIE